MPTIEEYGKPTGAEVTNYISVANDCDKLSKGLRTLSGIINKTAYINKINAGIVLIDTITALKTDLLADKAILEA